MIPLPSSLLLLAMRLISTEVPIPMKMGGLEWGRRERDRERDRDRDRDRDRERERERDRCASFAGNGRIPTHFYAMMMPKPCCLPRHGMIANPFSLQVLATHLVLTRWHFDCNVDSRLRAQSATVALRPAFLLRLADAGKVEKYYNGKHLQTRSV